MLGVEREAAALGQAVGVVYIDSDGCHYTVSRVGRKWGTCARSPAGDLRQVRAVPLAETHQEAQYNHDYWARMMRLKRLAPTVVIRGPRLREGGVR